MNEEQLRQRLNQELDMISLNQLNALGNQAVEMGLIAGHGYHGGQYEILRQGKAILLSATEAQTYLQNLITNLGE
jgi:hypothetical protein